MNKLDKKKKSIIILSTCLILLFTPKIKSSEEIIYNEEYVMESTMPFATLGNSNIYIGNREFIDAIRDDSTDDIYVIDQRDSSNPNMKVCNSYEIRDIDEIKRIVEILLQYELKYPSDWDRTKEAMLKEWIIHNICYDFSFRTNRTREVDLDNNDEKIYSYRRN